MNKLSPEMPELQSMNITADNITKLKSLFPEAFNEDSVDFEVLKQLLGENVDDKEERYGLNWHGKRQARQLGYQLLIACSEDQPDNEMRCIEHLLQRQVDAIIVSTSLPPEHPFYQRWANDPFPIVALDRALDREHFTSVVGADQDDAEMLAAELRTFPAETVLYLGALPELSVSFLREQGFRTAWKDDPREVHYLYANSYEREAAAQLFEKWLETHPMPQALFTTSFALLQGVMDVTLRRDGKLPSDLAIATFGDNELLDFLQCPVLAVAQRHRDVAERVLEIVLASLDEPRKPKPGLTRIKRNLYRRGILSRH